MCFVNDDELGAPMNEVLRSSGRLDEVRRDDRKWMPVEYRCTNTQIPLKALNRTAQHEFRLDVKLCCQLTLPLLGQVRRTEHCQASNLSSVEELSRDHRGFDGLANADVIGDEDPHRIELEGHHQRHKLI